MDQQEAAYSLRFAEAGAEFGRHSHCGELQPTEDSGHAKSHGLDSWIDLRLSRSCWNLDVQASAERLCGYLQTE